MLPPLRHRPSAPCITIAALLGAAGAAVAGPLNPPAGPVTSSYKTLSEVEPRTAINDTNTPGDQNSLYRITKPGSYYLTGNIVGVSGRSGIVVACSDVTIDLNGFGVFGGPGTLDGIAVAGAGDGQFPAIFNVTVMHGSVDGWGAGGVLLSAGVSFNTRIEDVRASHNGGSGLGVGVSGLILNCSSTYNKGSGLTAQSTSSILNCTATNNSARGIYAEQGCTITGCAIASSGFEGIRAADGCTISACTVRASHWDGISVTASCHVFDNTLEQSGFGQGSGAGIAAASSGNRIERNNCVGGDLGISVDSAGNWIVQNTCSANGINWSIVANNVHGPIIDRTSPASPAVFGNAGTDSTGSTHPNANYSY